MKVLMISGDTNVLNPGSAVGKRVALQRAQVGQLDALAYKGLWSGPIGFFNVLWVALRNRYDVITVQEPFFRGILGWVAARLTGSKLNIQVHTDLSSQPWWRHIMAQIVLRHADSIRVVSHKLADQVSPMAKSATIHVLPIYVDLTRFRAIAREPHETKTILWVGRFQYEKDPLYAIEILREVIKAGVKAKLTMLGKGSLEPRVREAAEDLPVELAGWADPAEYLRTADVVVSTSRHESYGASIIEALAAGVPVVSPNHGIAQEAGAIIAPREDLAREVVRVLQTGEQGELKLPLVSEEAWSRAWKESLV
jgi:glycosyltransferase involved in cell wall biosynthesis